MVRGLLYRAEGGTGKYEVWMKEVLLNKKFSHHESGSE